MCLSFQFQKHLSLGRVGMILTDDKDAAQELKKNTHDNNRIFFDIFFSLIRII